MDALPISINVANLSFAYGGRNSLIEIPNLSIGDAKIVSILGPSGCGKTTLLHLLAGILTPTHGKITIAGLDPVAFRRTGKLSFVFQNPALLPWRTARDNLSLPFELGDSPIDTDRVSEVLGLVGLDQFSGFYPDQLSGGMQSRLSLARALVTSPNVLFLDEPFSNLDEFNRLRLNLALANIQCTYKISVVLVTHNISDAIMISDRIIVLRPDDVGHAVTRVIDDIHITFPNKTLDSIRHEGFGRTYQTVASHFRDSSVVS